MPVPPLRSATSWMAALLLPALATLASLLLDRWMSVAGLAMVYMAAAALCALVLPRAQAVVASVACVTALNFFFVPPRYSFAVDDAEYWWTLAVLLAVSLLLQTLIGSLRERRAAAELAAARVADLHALAQALAEHHDPASMEQAAAQWLHARLGLPAAVVLVREAPPLTCIAAGAPPERFDLGMAQWAVDHGRVLGRGTEDWRDLPAWGAPFTRHGARGAVLVLLGGRDRPEADELQHWEALVRQIGLSVERERAAAEARAAREGARAESARNTLLASLSHDLRTPLAGILGSASTLRMQGDALTPSQRDRLLASLEDEARDLAAMADNVLQVARLSQPQQDLRLQWESIEDVLGAAVARMRRRWPQAHIELRCGPGLPPVRAEAGLLAQLVANLVDNAVRHGGGEPHVVVRAGRSRTGVFFAVRDHGAGLPAGSAAALFDKNRQGGAGGGAGLGLALCRMVAHAHGGAIEARACEPGAEFRVDLPAADAEVGHAA